MYYQQAGSNNNNNSKSTASTSCNPNNNNAFPPRLDLGEILFPDSGHLITNIIDLAPSLLTKPHYQAKPLFSVIEVLSKVVNFNLRLS